ncbi:hypothetical protein [Pontibacillus salipaludis]|uniref:hypothetical protein n=1 Tax=Pontibacillus salipaludis TaxID=1697394 RepID=UPI0031EACA12
MKKITLLGLGVLLLVACGSEDMSFSGESKNWRATIEVSETFNEQQTRDFELLFKGEDQTSIGEFQYSVDSNVVGFGENGISLNEKGTVQNMTKSNETNSKVTGRTDFEVIVEWNGNTEQFTLKNDE